MGIELHFQVLMAKMCLIEKRVRKKSGESQSANRGVHTLESVVQVHCSQLSYGSVIF